MDTCKAASLPPITRGTAWYDLHSTQFDHIDHTARNRDNCETEVHLGNLGPLRVVRVASSSSATHRRPASAGQPAARVYSFMLQTRGTGVLGQYGHETRLEEGDLALCDNAAPHSHCMGEQSEVVMLRVPARILREHLPAAEQFCGRRLQAADGITAAVTALVMSLCQRLGAGLPDVVQDRLAHQIMDMMATSYTLAFDTLIPSSSSVSARQAQAKLYIEQHLQDPDLGPRRIAGWLKVSSRYLRMIFAATDEPVSTYILRRRLEECARQLGDARWRGRSICDIAFGWGFNSAPHFSRSFRERFGMTPREYRMQNAGAHEPQQRNNLAAIF